MRTDVANGQLEHLTFRGSAMTFEPIQFDAGVYAVVSKKTGAMYVGCTCFLRQRLTTHLRDILKGKHQIRAVREAFKDHQDGDIELRILERVEVSESDTGEEWVGRDRLLQRERFWIQELNPMCNWKGRRIRPGRVIEAPRNRIKRVPYRCEQPGGSMGHKRDGWAMLEGSMGNGR